MTEKPNATTIRALDRGLVVIELLSRHGQMSLADLRRTTGLTNPTLLRILATLQNRGWVRRGIVEGNFELSHSLGQIFGSETLAHPLAEVAAPTLIDLKSRQSRWPSDLCAILSAGRIEIVESTRFRGPMAPTRTSLGIRPSLALSAHGRAVLAYSSDEQRKRHMAVIESHGNKEELRWINSGELDKEVARTKGRGYGLREPGYWQPPFDFGPELGALAVPILSDAGLHGTISLLWLAADETLDDVLTENALTDLQLAAAKIGASLARASVKPPAV